jgi:hypothetical protein
MKFTGNPSSALWCFNYACNHADITAALIPAMSFEHPGEAQFRGARGERTRGERPSVAARADTAVAIGSWRSGWATGLSQTARLHRYWYRFDHRNRGAVPPHWIRRRHCRWHCNWLPNERPTSPKSCQVAPCGIETAARSVWENGDLRGIPSEPENNDEWTETPPRGIMMNEPAYSGCINARIEITSIRSILIVTHVQLLSLVQKFVACAAAE